MRYRAFRRKKDKLFYFQFLSESDLVLLNSQSYRDKNNCFNGIRSVLTNAGKPENYVRHTDDKGNHFFILKAANGQEIGQSRRYATPEELDSAIHLFVAEGPVSTSKLPDDHDTKAKPQTESKAVKDSAEPKKKQVSGEENANQERIYLKEEEPALGNGIVYDTFQSGGNQRYYFVFKDKDGKAILINSNVRGFATAEAVEKGVEEVIEYAPLDSQYKTKTAKNGKYYFLLKGDKGKTVARSSLFFDRKEEMDKVLILLQSADSKQEIAKATAKPPAGKTTDEYLPCTAYAGPGGFYTFQKEENEKYYFAYNDAEGKTFLRSEGYKSVKSRDKGIQSVIKNAPQEKRWGTTEQDGNYFYYLRAGNNQEIARSCPFKDENTMLAALSWLQSEGTPSDSGTIAAGGAVLSAAMLAGGMPPEENAATSPPPQAETVEPDVPEDKNQESEEPEKDTSEGADLDKAAIAAGAAGLVTGMGKDEEPAETMTSEELEAAEKAKIEAEVEADKMKAKEAARLAAEAEEAKRKKKEEEAALAAAALAAANRKAEEEAKIAEEEKQKRAAAALAASQANDSAQKVGPQDGKSKNEDKGGLGWLLPLLLGILLIVALLYFMKGCEGCAGAGKTDDDPNTEITDNNAGGQNGADNNGTAGDSKNGAETDSTGDSSGDGSDDAVKNATDGGKADSGNDDPGSDAAGGSKNSGNGKPDTYGKDGKAFGFSAGSMEDEMANHLSAGGSKLTKTFWADKIKFNKNNARLRSAARKQLDNLAVLLKAYPDANIDIYGYINDREDISYQGSKEVTLDDARSKAVYNYLISRGIDKNRLDFFGNGLNDEGGIELKLKT